MKAAARAAILISVLAILAGTILVTGSIGFRQRTRMTAPILLAEKVHEPILTPGNREGSGEREDFDEVGTPSSGSAYRDRRAWMKKHRSSLEYPPVLKAAQLKLVQCQSPAEYIAVYSELLAAPELSPYLGYLYVGMASAYASMGSIDQCEECIRLAISRSSETTFAPDLELLSQLPLNHRPGDRSFEPLYVAIAISGDHKATHPDFVADYALWRLATLEFQHDDQKYELTLKALSQQGQTGSPYGLDDLQYLKERVKRDQWLALYPDTYHIRLDDKAALRLATFYESKNRSDLMIQVLERLLNKYADLNLPHFPSILKLANCHLQAGRKDEAHRIAAGGLEALRLLPTEFSVASALATRDLIEQGLLQAAAASQR